MRRKWRNVQVLFVGTLVLFVAAGVCSGVLVATGKAMTVLGDDWMGVDWRSMSSGDSFAGLGVMLFLIGAGIGAVIVLMILWILSCQKRKKNKTIFANAAVDGTLAHGKSEKANNDIQSKTYTIHVQHMQEAQNNNDVCYKMSKMTRKGEAECGVYSPKHKAWEKSGQTSDIPAAPTPRIYVLPPDSPTGTGLYFGNHSRSRSELPFNGKLGFPDVSILDIKDNMNKSTEESDIEAGLPSEVVDSEGENDTNPEFPSKELSAPIIRPIDTHLNNFVQNLDRSRETTLTYMLSIMIEEVLPRPDSGLLKRMLRMSEIPVGAVEGSGDPILHLRIGSECHLSIGLIRLNDHTSESMQLTGPHSIKVKPLDGEEMDLNATCEAVDGVEHVTSAFWDLKSHTSYSMTRESGASISTVLTPIEMTLGFHVHQHERDLIRAIEVKKTFMASMRRELVSLEVDQRFKHDDAVLDFVLSKMELISMPSLLMFLEVESNETKI